MKVKIKRVYEPAAGTDGYRILVDRLWPRGLSKSHASVDLWLKEIAPSSELRKWFAHDPKKWNLFRQRYIAELKLNKVQVTALKSEIKVRNSTLVYGARDEEHNHAIVLQRFLARLR